MQCTSVRLEYARAEGLMGQMARLRRRGRWGAASSSSGQSDGHFAPQF